MGTKKSVLSVLFGRRPESIGRRPEPIGRCPESISRRPEPIGRRPESISRKYSRGYFLILSSAFLVFVFSFINSQIVTFNYQQELDDLLAINRIYADAGNVHNMFINVLPQVNGELLGDIREEIIKTRQSLQNVSERLNEDYNRDVMDLCCMVETYMDQVWDITLIIEEYAGDDEVDLFDALVQSDFFSLRLESESTNNYIENSFRDIYSTKLMQAQQIRGSLNSFRLIMNIIQVSIMLAALGGCLLFYKDVVNGISKSVAKLTQFTKDIKKDPEIQRRILIQTGDEIELFAVSFNEMLDQIQRQIVALAQDAQIKEQLAAAEMENLRMISALNSNELKLLQSRINPHFLFNTLNLIVQTAKIENAGDTARLLEITAELLRYSMSKLSVPVTIADEIENIRNYLIIQKSRFGDHLSFQIDVDENCLGQQIPCMILQPLVENAITHGIGPKIEGGEIFLRVFRNGPQYCIEVEDDGVGIPSEKLKQVKNACINGIAGSSSIGINNVYQRLLIFYQHDVVFDITSALGKTLFHIELPLCVGNP